MADLTISPDVIRDALKDFAAAYEPTAAAATEVGTVVDAADGIAHVEGLPGVMANELIRFDNGVEGLAQNLDEHEVGVGGLQQGAALGWKNLDGVAEQREARQHLDRGLQGAGEEQKCTHDGLLPEGVGTETRR